MKIRGTTFNGVDPDKCYPGHDPEQHSRSSSHRSDILSNANADSTVTFKLYNSQST